MKKTEAPGFLIDYISVLKCETRVECSLRETNTHVVLQETEVFSPKGAFGQRGHRGQIQSGQPDPGTFSATTSKRTLKFNSSRKTKFECLNEKASK